MNVFYYLDSKFANFQQKSYWAQATEVWNVEIFNTPHFASYNTLPTVPDGTFC